MLPMTVVGAKKLYTKSPVAVSIEPSFKNFRFFMLTIGRSSVSAGEYFQNSISENRNNTLFIIRGISAICEMNTIPNRASEEVIRQTYQFRAWTPDAKNRINP